MSTREEVLRKFLAERATGAYDSVDEAAQQRLREQRAHEGFVEYERRPEQERTDYRELMSRYGLLRQRERQLIPNEAAKTSYLNAARSRALADYKEKHTIASHEAIRRQERDLYAQQDAWKNRAGSYNYSQTLDDLYDRLLPINEQYNDYMKNMRNPADGANSRAGRSRMLDTSYSGGRERTVAPQAPIAVQRDDILRQINSTKRDYNLAKTREDASKYNAYFSDPEFNSAALKGSQIGKISDDVKTNGYVALPDDVNKVEFAKSHKDDISNAMLTGQIRPEIVKWHIYTYMTDDEAAIYDYLLYKQGSNAADEYLDFIEETLNARKGTEAGEKITSIDSPIIRGTLEATAAVGAGLDQFGSGVAQVFSRDVLPTSSTQFASQHIRESLKDKGAKILGNSLGQIAYDAISTTANMAPSILLSYITGGLGASAAVSGAIGSAALGAGAMGNAYNQVRKEGYAEGEARVYSILTGASEAGLQYLLGGISKLGGKLPAKLAQGIGNIDNALLRVSAKIGINAFSEGTEEYLQDILAPVFKNLAYGEQNSVPVYTEEALYSFLLGAITAGVIEGGGTISASRAGNNIIEAGHSQALVDNALTLNPTTEAYKQAEKIKSGKAKANGSTIGELMQLYVEAGGDTHFVTDVNAAAHAKGLDVAKNASNAAATPVATAQNADIAAQSRANTPVRNKPVQSTKKGVYATTNDGDPVSVMGVSRVVGGDMYVKTDIGDMKFKELLIDDENISTLYEGASKLDTTSAKAFVAGYTGGNVRDYASGFYEVYGLARNRPNFKTATNGLYASNLTEEQKLIAYEAGRRNDLTKKAGVIKAYTVPVTRGQDRQIQAIDAVFKTFGKRVFIENSIDVENNGEVAKSAGNAYYDPKTGEYHIAVDSVGGAYMYYAVHESVHGLKTTETGSGYDLLESVTLDVLKKQGQDVDALIEYQKSRLPNKKGMTQAEIEAYAREEVVANTVPAILTDPETAKLFAERFAKDKGNWFERLLDSVEKYLKKAYEVLRGQKSWEQMDAVKGNIDALADIREVYFIALEAAKESGKVESREKAKYSVNEDFASEYDAWDKKDAQGYFVVGTTSEALESIGVNPADIQWDKGKIVKIKEKHPAMTDKVIKQVPNILESPILILQSKQLDSRVVLFGEVFDANNVPVLAVLELQPKVNQKYALNVIKIASAYGKDSNPQKLINESKLLYVEPNKNRTDSWLEGTRLQLPFNLKHYGSIDTISQPDTTVNTSIREKAQADTTLRFSAKDTNTVERLTKKNEKLKDALELMKQEFKLTKGHHVSDAALNILAGKTLKKYQSKADKQAVVAGLRKLYDYIGNAEIVAWDSVAEYGTSLAREILEQSSARDTSAYDTFESARKLLKDTTISLNKVQIAEVGSAFGSMAEFRAALHSRVKLSQATGASLVEMWPEIASMTGLDENLNDGDMPTALYDFLNSAYDKPIYNPYSYNMDEAALDLFLEMHDAFFDIPEVKTFADKKQAQIDKLRAQYKTKLDEARNGAAKDKHIKNIEKIAKDFYTRLMRPTDKKHIPEDMRRTVIDFIKTLDFAGTSASVEANKWRERMKAMGDLAAKVSVGEGFYADVDPDLINRIDSIYDMTSDVLTVRDLDTQQLAELDIAVTALKTMMLNADKLHANERYSSIADLGAASVREMNRRKQYTKNTSKLIERCRNILNVSMLDSFSYFEALGEVPKTVLGGLRKGFDRKVRNTEAAIDFMKETLKGIDVKKWSGDHAPKTKYRVAGGELELTPAQVIELYCLNKRAQARGHIYGSGITINGAKPISVTDSDVINIVSTLTPEQKKIADAMQKYLTDDIAALGNVVSMTLYGYKKFGSRNYWPIATDKNFVDTRVKNDESNLYALKNVGATKQTVDNANNALTLGDAFDTFTKHVDVMTSYNAYVVPLADAMAWYNYKNGGTSVKQSIENVMGRAGQEYFVNLVSAINGNRSAKPTPIDALLRNAKTAAVGANIRVVLQQPTAYMRALNMMNAKYLTEGALTPWKIKQGMEKAKKYSGIAKWKSWGYYDMSLGSYMRELIIGDTNAAQKVKEAALAPAGWADEITWGALWNACENETKALRTDLDDGTEEFNQAVGQRLSDIIDRTQVVDSVFHRSQAMRNDNGLIKLYTAFMSEPTKSYNMLHSAAIMYATDKSKESRRKVWRAWGTFALTAMTTAAAASVADAFRNDDKEKDWLERYKEAILANSVDNLNPLNLIPGARDMVSIIEGYSASRLDLQGVERLINVAEQWYKFIQGDTKWNAYRLIYKTAEAVSYATGIPVGNAMRVFNSLYNTFSPDGIDWENDTATTEKAYTTMYDALMNGDKDKYDKTRDSKKLTGKTEKDIDIGVADILMNNPDIAIALGYKNSAQTDKLKAFYAKYEAMGFSHEMIRRAINKYDQSLTEKADDEKPYTDGAIWDYDNLKTAIDAAIGSGDYAHIDEITADLLATSTAKDPQKNLYENVRSDYSDLYLEYIEKHDPKAAKLGKILTSRFGMTEEKLNDWVKEDKSKKMMEAAREYKLSETNKYIDHKRELGQTDSQIASALTEEFKDKYLEALKKGGASKITNFLSKLDLYDSDGDPYYNEDKFISWQCEEPREKMKAAAEKNDVSSVNAYIDKIVGLGVKQDGLRTSLTEIFKPKVKELYAKGGSQAVKDFVKDYLINIKLYHTKDGKPNYKDPFYDYETVFKWLKD